MKIGIGPSKINPISSMPFTEMHKSATAWLRPYSSDSDDERDGDALLRTAHHHVLRAGTQRDVKGNLSAFIEILSSGDDPGCL